MLQQGSKLRILILLYLDLYPNDGQLGTLRLMEPGFKFQSLNILAGYHSLALPLDATNPHYATDRKERQPLIRNI